MNQGNGPSSRYEEGEPGLFVSCGVTLSVALYRRWGYLGSFELPHWSQEPLSWLRREAGISLQKPQRKRASARVEGKISWFFSSWGGVPLKLQQGPQGPASGASGRYSLKASRKGPLGIPLQSLPGLRFSSGVEVETSGFLSRADMDLGVPLRHPEGSQDLLSCGAMQVRSPLDPEKQFQSSCRVDHRDQCFCLEEPQGCHTCPYVLSPSSR